LGVFAAVYAAKGFIPSSITACSKRDPDHSVLNIGTTCDAAFLSNFLINWSVVCVSLQWLERHDNLDIWRSGSFRSSVARRSRSWAHRRKMF